MSANPLRRHGSARLRTAPPAILGGLAVTPPDDLSPLLTPDEAAELLRTSRRAIYALVERGQVAGSVRIGRRLLFRRNELLAWLGLSEGGKRR